MVIFAMEGVSGPAERFRVCKYQNQGDSNEMSRTVTIGIPACCHWELMRQYRHLVGASTLINLMRSDIRFVIVNYEKTTRTIGEE